MVSTDCPSGPSEILEDGLWGELVPPGNPDLLAQAIINSLDNLVQKDVKTRAEFFSVDNAISQYINFFLQIVFFKSVKVDKNKLRVKI